MALPAQRNPVLVVGGGLLALGIVRALHPFGVPITVVSTAHELLLRHSRRCRLVRAASASHDAIMDTVRAEIARTAATPVLIPAGDLGLSFACEQAAALTPHVHTVLPSATAARTVMEKDRFDAYAQLHGVPVPSTWAFTSVDEIRREATHLPFPLAVKPAVSSHWHTPAFTDVFGHIKMLRADSPAELLSYADRIAQVAPLPLLQEFVVGDDHEHYSYVSYRNREGLELSGTLIQKVRLNPIRYGLGACARAVRHEGMEQIGRHVTATLPYHSVASVCFKRDVRTGEPKVFEVNGRLPLNFPSVALAGVNLPWLMYRDALGESPAPETAVHYGRWWSTLSHDMWAAIQYHKAGQQSVFGWMWSYRNVREVLELDWRDPGPGIAFAADAARLAARRIARAL